MVQLYVADAGVLDNGIFVAEPAQIGEAVTGSTEGVGFTVTRIVLAGLGHAPIVPTRIYSTLPSPDSVCAILVPFPAAAPVTPVTVPSVHAYEVADGVLVNVMAVVEPEQMSAGFPLVIAGVGFTV